MKPPKQPPHRHDRTWRLTIRWVVIASIVFFTVLLIVAGVHGLL